MPTPAGSRAVTRDPTCPGTAHSLAGTADSGGRRGERARSVRGSTRRHGLSAVSMSRPRRSQLRRPYPEPRRHHRRSTPKSSRRPGSATTVRRAWRSPRRGRPALASGSLLHAWGGLSPRGRRQRDDATAAWKTLRPVSTEDRPRGRVADLVSALPPPTVSRNPTGHDRWPRVYRVVGPGPPAGAHAAPAADSRHGHRRQTPPVTVAGAAGSC